MERLFRTSFYFEPQARGMPENTPDADRVLAEALCRIADDPDLSPGQVFETSDIINHRQGDRVIKKSIDCDISPEGIFTGRSIGAFRVGHGQGGVLFPGLRVFPKCRHLDDFAILEMDMSQAETPSDDQSIREALLDLSRPGIGDDIEILGWLPQHHVPNCAAGQVGDEAEPMETKKDFEDIRVADGWQPVDVLFGSSCGSWANARPEVVLAILA